MNKEEYCAYRNWIIPENEDPTEEGYLVEYLDGGKTNDSRHEGYISWSPKEVFEKSYLCIGDAANMPPHQQRVVGEAAELKNKLQKLNGFFGTQIYINLPDEEQNRLIRQFAAMKEYYEILNERIANF